MHVECITISEKGYTQRRHAVSFRVCDVPAGAGCSRDRSQISSCQAWIGGKELTEGARGNVFWLADMSYILIMGVDI